MKNRYVEINYHVSMLVDISPETDILYSFIRFQYSHIGANKLYFPKSTNFSLSSLIFSAPHTNVRCLLYMTIHLIQRFYNE